MAQNELSGGVECRTELAQPVVRLSVELNDHSPFLELADNFQFLCKHSPVMSNYFVSQTRHFCWEDLGTSHR